MYAGWSCQPGEFKMRTDVNRRDFLRGAQALAVVAVLNRAYARVAPEDVAIDEDFWKKIRDAYPHDQKILNLNNGGVAPAPDAVLDAQIEALRTATSFQRTACGTIWSLDRRRSERPCPDMECRSRMHCHNAKRQRIAGNCPVWFRPRTRRRDPDYQSGLPPNDLCVATARSAGKGRAQAA